LSLVLSLGALELWGDERDYVPGGPTGPTSPSARLGVGFAGELPTFDLQIPDSKSEVAGEVVAKLGLSWMRDVLDGTPDAGDDPPVPPPVLGGLREARLAWFYGRLGFTPVGALAGGVYGNLTGASARTIDGALPALTDSLVQFQLPAGFEPLLLGLVREKVPGMLVLTNRLPVESSFPFPSLMETVAPLPADLLGMRTARSDIGGFGGTDVAVLLRVVNWGLSGRDGRNSPLSVSFVVKGTVVNAKERTRVRSFYASYESPKQKFAAWSADAAKPFRDELWRGLESIATQIAGELPTPPPQPAALVGPAL
jgi:hypothetical protein